MHKNDAREVVDFLGHREQESVRPPVPSSFPHLALAFSFPLDVTMNKYILLLFSALFATAIIRGSEFDKDRKGKGTNGLFCTFVIVM